ncbi:PepSY domain-containing protein [Azonexus fungiphilus]|jgi:hypothetical protein|uniref:PepSY domain-containing protein n=1 Tax=Azonexus fungiphilus TaxID=146940 RepID=UPI00156B524F|nr:PepSY domain-containing protein [Azonexus fungiphilus]NHC06202.1 PepSY domain-containing protein [Azonexus fungiphilus]
MHRIHHCLAALLAACSLGVAAGETRQPPAGGWLPMSALVARLEAAGYRNIEEIEREHGHYEVRATDRQGLRGKFLFDARSGELLVPRPAGQAAGEARECSKRRCRDDLPAGGGRP